MSTTQPAARAAVASASATCLARRGQRGTAPSRRPETIATIRKAAAYSAGVYHGRMSQSPAPVMTVK